MEVQEELPQNFNNNLFPAINPPEVMIEPEGSTSNTILVQEQALTVDQNAIRNENNQIEPMEEVEEAPEAEDPAQESNVEKRCDFCGYTCNENEGLLLQEHIQDCELRKIWCDKCEQRVIIDIFDAHYNDCNADREGSEAEEQEGNQEGNMEEEGNGENQGRQQQARPRRNRTSMYLPESSLTYEQLLLLDETIVKKGLTAEQLKKFRVRVYVKSLDGEGFCNICMCNYNTGEYTRELTCRHKFHECCVDQWLGMNITCPTCKKYLR